MALVRRRRRRRGFKYYGPGGEHKGARRELEPAAGDRAGEALGEAQEQSGRRHGDGPDPARRPQEGGEQAVARPPVPNCVVLLPTYRVDDLMDIMCAVIPRASRVLRDVGSLLRTSGLVRKHVSVVQFVEQLARSLQDIDKEDEVVVGSGNVEFWLEMEDKLQAIALRRLNTKRRVALPFVASDGPSSHTEDQNAHVGGHDHRSSASADVEGSNVPELERQEAGVEEVAEEGGPPTNLRLEIPDEPATMVY